MSETTLIPANASTEMASRRTGMAFQRTRMAADRTLMAVIRTSFSMIGFGFTIFQFFHKLHISKVLERSAAPRNFGQALVWLGIAVLALGIFNHALFMYGLRKQRKEMKAEHLIHGESIYPVSSTLIAALLLLTLALFTIFGMSFNVGPLVD